MSKSVCCFKNSPRARNVWELLILNIALFIQYHPLKMSILLLFWLFFRFCFFFSFIFFFFSARRNFGYHGSPMLPVFYGRSKLKCVFFVIILTYNDWWFTITLICLVDPSSVSFRLTRFPVVFLSISALSAIFLPCQPLCEGLFLWQHSIMIFCK